MTTTTPKTAAPPHCACALCSQDFAVPDLINVGGYPMCKSCLEKVAADVVPARRRFHKIVEGKYIAGVCGGLADACNMDRDIFRFIVFLAACFTAFIPVIAAYIVLAFVLPAES